MSNKRIHNEGYGSLFANSDKSKPGAPDYSGEVTLNGQPYRIAGWKKAGKTGTTYLSLSIEPRSEKGADHDDF